MHAPKGRDDKRDEEALSNVDTDEGSVLRTRRNGTIARMFKKSFWTASRGYG